MMGRYGNGGYIGNKAYDKPVKIMDNVKRLLSFGYVIKKMIHCGFGIQVLVRIQLSMVFHHEK